MERFVKEYANYLLKTAKEQKDALEVEKINRTIHLRERGVISTNETIISLARIACPDRFNY